jgi:hypothetical protein
MKKTFLAGLLLLCIVLMGVPRFSNAQAPKTNHIMENSKEDSLAINQLLENYFKGLYDGNVTLLATLYHPATLLYGDVKGTPYAKTLEQYLDGVKNRQSPKDSGKPFKGDILMVDLVNSIAVVKVRVKMYDFDYNDLLSLHKIDGRWLIVNKMITDVSK